MLNTANICGSSWSIVTLVLVSSGQLQTHGGFGSCNSVYVPVDMPLLRWFPQTEANRSKAQETILLSSRMRSRELHFGNFELRFEIRSGTSHEASCFRERAQSHRRYRSCFGSGGTNSYGVSLDGRRIPRRKEPRERMQHWLMGGSLGQG